MGGREGPRPPLGLHEHQHSRACTRRRPRACQGRAGHRGDPAPRRPCRRAALPPRHARVGARPRPRPRLPPPDRRRPGARWHAAAARPGGGGGGDAARPVASAVGVHRRRRTGRRTGRVPPEGPSHDHGRRRRREAVAQPARLRARPAGATGAFGDAAHRRRSRSRTTRRGLRRSGETRLAGERRSKRPSRTRFASSSDALGAASSPPRTSWPARSRRAAASTTPSGSPDRCGGSCS